MGHSIGNLPRLIAKRSSFRQNSGKTAECRAAGMWRVICALLVLAVAFAAGCAASGAKNGDDVTGADAADGTTKTADRGAEAGVGGDVPSNGSDEILRFLSIEGDVKNNISMRIGQAVKNDAARPGDADFEGVALPDFLSGSAISGTPSAIWLISSGDGFAVKIDWAGAERVFVVFSEKKGWCVIAPDHPISANAMDIDRIIVQSEGSAVGLRIQGADGRDETIPMSRLLTASMTADFHFEGRAEQKSREGNLTSEVYTRRFAVRFADVYAAYSGGGFAVATADGGLYLTNGAGLFEINRQRIDYIETTGDVYADVKTVQLR